MPSRSSMLRIFPGTARHIERPPFSQPRIPHQQLTQRDAAVVGRHVAMGDHVETLGPQRRARPAAAAARSGTPRRTARRCGAGRRRPRRGRRRDRRPRGGTARRSRPAAYTGAARRRSTARQHGRGVDHRRRSRAVDCRRCTVAPRSASRRQPFQLDRRLRLVGDHLADAGQRRDGVEQPAHAGGRRAAEPGLELVPQHAALVVWAGPHRCAGRRPRPGRPPTGAPAPSGRAAAR